MNVAAYCRVSTEQETQVSSLANQKNFFREYIMQHPDWILREIYYDNGISGTSTRNRTGFNRMLTDALQGGIDLIVTKEVSRFARNTVDTLLYTRKLREQHVGVLFLTDGIDTREPDGELRLSIMATLAQEESRKTSMRVKWGQQRRMQDGVVFGRDLLGYTVQNGQLFVNPAEAEIVKLIFHLFLHEKSGTHRIAQTLLERGILPKYAAAWSNTVILRILRNEKYVGDLCQKKSYTPDYLTHVKQCNTGQEPLIYLPQHHEAIIDRGTWDSVQAELARRASNAVQNRRHSSRYWCSGKLLCGVCGGSLVSRAKPRNNGERYLAWRCRENARHGKRKQLPSGLFTGCTSHSVNDQVLLQAIVYCLRLFPVDCAMVRKTLVCSIQQYLPEQDFAMRQLLRDRLRTIEEKQSKAIALALDNIITRSALQTQLKQYYAQQDSINQQLAAIPVSATDTTDYAAAMDQVLQFDASETAFYHSMLAQIIVRPHSQLSVFLHGLPWGLQLHFQTSGRGAAYQAVFTLLGIVPR